MKQLLFKLENLGFYKYMDPRYVRDAEAEILKTGRLNSKLTRRSFHADAESVLEGGGKELIEDISFFLESQGFPIDCIEQDYDTGGLFYFIIINGEEFTVYTEVNESELELDWDFTMKQMIKLINDLLKQTDSKERAYLLYEWNDSTVIFLTPEMYDAILESSEIDEYFKPKPIC